MTYRFTAPVPYRGLVLAGLVSLAGAVLAVLSQAQRWPSALVVVGLAVLLAGVAWMVATVIAHRRQAATVILSDQGWQIRGPGSQAAGTWSAVTRVAGTSDGLRLSIESGSDVTHILRPPGGDDALWDRLTDDVARRLDADRGYRNVI